MHRKHWITAPITALVLLLGLALGATPAAAALATGQACNYHGTYNACLSMYPGPAGSYTTNVGAGFDLSMSQAQAAALLARSDFVAKLYTTAGGRRYVMDLPIRPGWPQAGPTGLGVEFGVDGVANDFLNRVTGDNAFRVEITHYEYLTTPTEPDTRYTTYLTGVIHGTLPVPVPPVCIVVCP